MKTRELDSLVESHLNLQVKISYSVHHDFLLRHHLNDCKKVLDVGTGNGAFVARLALDHPEIQFVGIDKRALSIESCQKFAKHNLEFTQFDMFARDADFDLSNYDGFLLRYFLLHVDNANKVLELFKLKAKPGARFWIIDLDWSKFNCEPHHSSFDKLTQLVRDFCAQVSVESSGGQNVMPLLQKLGFHNIVVEHLPFTAEKIPQEDLALYLKQEVQCYTHMIGRSMNDPDTQDILQFIEENVRSGISQISYGMVLIKAEHV